MRHYNLPVNYKELKVWERKIVREQYRFEQNFKCFYCKCSLHEPPPKEILDKPLDLSLFPEGFLDYPIHLQQDHKTGMTEGAVHAYCNGIMWQYEHR